MKTTNTINNTCFSILIWMRLKTTLALMAVRLVLSYLLYYVELVVVVVVVIVAVVVVAEVVVVVVRLLPLSSTQPRLTDAHLHHTHNRILNTNLKPPTQIYVCVTSASLEDKLRVIINKGYGARYVI